MTTQSNAGVANHPISQCFRSIFLSLLSFALQVISHHQIGIASPLELTLLKRIYLQAITSKTPHLMFSFHSGLWPISWLIVAYFPHSDPNKKRVDFKWRPRCPENLTLLVDHNFLSGKEVNPFVSNQSNLTNPLRYSSALPTKHSNSTAAAGVLFFECIHYFRTTMQNPHNQAINPPTNHTQKNLLSDKTWPSSSLWRRFHKSESISKKQHSSSKASALRSASP